MNINQLFYFVELINSDFEVSKTAEKIHVSQSAISKVISHLENEAGTSLFKRNGKKIVGLTQKGLDFYRRAQRLTRDYQQMMDDLTNNHLFKSKIKIGVASGILDTYFARILPNFIESHSQTQLVLKNAGSAQLQRELLAGNIDLAYLSGPVDYDSLVQNSLISAPVTAIYNQKYFSFEKSVTISQFKTVPLVLLEQQFGLRQRINTLFRMNKITPKIVLSANSESLLLNLCRQAPYITILPQTILSAYQMNDLVAIPLLGMKWALVSATNKSGSDPTISKIQSELDQAILNLS